jgi:2-deoxy-D-gluconate 3-dehydrogenase
MIPDKFRPAEKLQLLPVLPEDPQGAMVFRASTAPGYVTGYTLAADGGWLCR